jgi:hypothetical protein
MLVRMLVFVSVLLRVSLQVSLQVLLQVLLRVSLQVLTRIPNFVLVAIRDSTLWNVPGWYRERMPKYLLMIPASRTLLLLRKRPKSNLIIKSMDMLDVSKQVTP